MNPAGRLRGAIRRFREVLKTTKRPPVRALTEAEIESATAPTSAFAYSIVLKRSQNNETLESHKVSIILLSYNLERYIGRATQSVIAQSHSNWELLVTDDGSTDSSIEIVSSFHDDRIKLFKFDRNQGACAAFNNSLRNASGEFLCYIGADDEFHPDKLQIQLEQLEEKPDVAAVFSDIQVIDEDDKPVYDEFLGKIFKQPNRSRFQWLNTFFYNANCLTHPSVMARKTAYDSIGFMDNRLRQLPDLDFWVRLCLGHEIYVSPLVTASNRLRTGGANVSTPDRTKVMRHKWEHIQILRRYCSLSKEDLFKVFPDLKSQYSDIEERFRHFVLAQAANRSSSYVHRLFSLELMYQLLESEEFVAYVHSRYGYNHDSFFEASGAYLLD